jgi:hypothetical protein
MPNSRELVVTTKVYLLKTFTHSTNIYSISMCIDTENNIVAKLGIVPTFSKFTVH